MAKAIGEPEHPYLNLLTGVGFSHLADKRALLDQLASRREKLVPLREFLAKNLLEVVENRKHPVTADAIIEYYMAMIELEIEWLDAFSKKIDRIREWPKGAMRQ
jgi:hypothetical protein